MDKLIYEFSKNDEFLQQYYKLRGQRYRDTWKLKDFSGKKEKYDNIGHILIARIENKVIGGTRIVITNNNRHIKLPLEDDDFILTKLFPKYKLETKNYAEVGRFSIIPDMIGKDLIPSFILHTFALLQISKCSYLFAIAPSKLARLYRKACKEQGINITIKEGIIVPQKTEYKSITMKLLLSDLSWNE